LKLPPSGRPEPRQCRRALGKRVVPHLHADDVLGHELRDRREGWMQLELRSGRKKVRLDSRIEGFAELVGKSANAAKSRGLTLNAATVANLGALGVRLHSEPGVREAAGDPV